MTYSVKEVSELWKVNEETVRRWIRSGALSVKVFDSRKNGYQIDAIDLAAFCFTHPRYSIPGITVDPDTTKEIEKINTQISDLKDQIKVLEKRKMFIFIKSKGKRSYTVKEMSEITGKSESEIQRYCQSGGFKGCYKNEDGYWVIPVVPKKWPPRTSVCVNY